MHVELIDRMGDDIRVADAARVSFAKKTGWILDGEFGEKRILPEGDEKLINYLAKHNHWTPFSHVVITLREKVPIFVARQRFKHMVGFSYNEVSRRYVDSPPEFFVPEAWRQRAENKKQGSSDETVEWLDLKEHVIEDDLSSPLITISIKESYETLIEDVKQLYQMMIDSGVAPEQARMILPQSMYTEYYVTGSLAAWTRAYKLRIDPHAQKEIQDLAKMWGETIGSIEDIKYSWKALTSD